MAELCRKHGISDATFYNWKAKYGGMEVSEAKRLKALEEENAKLKKLLVTCCPECTHSSASPVHVVVHLGPSCKFVRREPVEAGMRPV